MSAQTPRSHKQTQSVLTVQPDLRIHPRGAPRGMAVSRASASSAAATLKRLFILPALPLWAERPKPPEFLGMMATLFSTLMARSLPPFPPWFCRKSCCVVGWSASGKKAAPMARPRAVRSSPVSLTVTWSSQCLSQTTQRKSDWNPPHAHFLQRKGGVSR